VYIKSIKSISDLFVATDAKNKERSLSKVSKEVLIFSWQGKPGKEGAYPKNQKVFLFSSWKWRPGKKGAYQKYL
jgi:hypothetical protein